MAVAARREHGCRECRDIFEILIGGSAAGTQLHGSQVRTGRLRQALEAREQLAIACASVRATFRSPLMTASCTFITDTKCCCMNAARSARGISEGGA